MSCPAAVAAASAPRPYGPKDAAIAADLQSNEGPIKCTWNFNNSTGTVREQHDKQQRNRAECREEAREREE
jgi:hypothetical protein